MSEAPSFFTLDTLSDNEESVRSRLISQLYRARRFNARQESFYEGSRRVRDLGIAIPPSLKDVEAVAAWPEIVVDVMDERMDWRGWSMPGNDDFNLPSIFDQNHLEVEVAQATLDSLICGISFLSVGTGDEGEPDVLIKAESPSRVTATWDVRLRRVTEALAETYDSYGRLTGWTLYLPDQTIVTERQSRSVVVTTRDQHGMGRVPIVALPNRPRGSRLTGRSEITRAVRSLTESGMRTLLGMEVAREFFGAPQRYAMGADESMFVDEQGNQKSQWDVVMGKMLLLPRDDNDQNPDIGTFTAASPMPFTELLKTYSQMISAATGIPVTHLGFNTDNPASADAIQRADKRLDSRTRKREKGFDPGLVELGNLAVLWRDGELPEPGSINSLWVDPDSPTPSAMADRASKMIAAGVLDPTWDFTLEQFGLDDADIARVAKERSRGSASAALRAVTAAAAANAAGVTGADNPAA